MASPTSVCANIRHQSHRAKPSATATHLPASVTNPGAHATRKRHQSAIQPIPSQGAALSCENTRVRLRKWPRFFPPLIPAPKRSSLAICSEDSPPSSVLEAQTAIEINGLWERGVYSVLFKTWLHWTVPVEGPLHYQPPGMGANKPASHTAAFSHSIQSAPLFVKPIWPRQKSLRLISMIHAGQLITPENAISDPGGCVSFPLSLSRSLFFSNYTWKIALEQTVIAFN